MGVLVTLALRIDPFLNPDSHAFESLARALLNGQGFKYREPMLPGLDLFAFRAPAYPVFVALGLALGGVGTVIALQGALNGLSAALVGAIAGHLGGVRAAWIAFALRMVWPAAWFQSGLLLSELLYECLAVLATWLVVECIHRRRLSWSVLAGVTTAAAFFTRPVALVLAFALGLWLLLRYRRAAVAFALTVLIAWVPWPIRNAQRLHAFVPTVTNGGALAWCGTAGGEVHPAWEWMAKHLELGEVGLDRHFYDLAYERMRRDPARAVLRSIRWATVYLGPIQGRGGDLWVHRFAMLAALPALLLGAWRRRLALPALIWGGHGALLVPITIIERYRFPTEWCAVIAAALGLVGFAERFGTRRAVVAAGLALALCIVGGLLTLAPH